MNIFTILKFRAGHLKMSGAADGDGETEEVAAVGTGGVEAVGTAGTS